MIVKAVLLIVVLAHGGFWFGGRPNRVDWTWNLPAAQIPAAEFRWRLQYGKIVMASGTVPLAAGKEAGSLDVTLPEFRAPSDLVLHYDLVTAGAGDVLESGGVPLHGVPDGLLGQAGKLVAKKKIAVLDSNDGLADLMKRAGVDFWRIAGLSDLQLASPDILIIGQDALGDVLAQDDLLDRACAGANIVVLAQNRTKQTVGYALGDHSTRAALAMAQRHPLLIGFTLEDMQAWARCRDALRAVQLPANEPAHELLYWPVETPGKEASPIDALAVTRTMAPAQKGQPAGRIILFQIPLSDWRDDPRGSMLMANILEYTVTGAQPTLPPGERTPAGTQPQADSGDLLKRE